MLRVEDFNTVCCYFFAVGLVFERAPGCSLRSPTSWSADVRDKPTRDLLLIRERLKCIGVILNYI
jgi:hypothetical protein